MKRWVKRTWKEIKFRDEEIKSLFLKGMRNKDLAVEFGLSLQRVAHITAPFVPERNKLRMEYIQERMAEGASQRKISAELGFTHSAVCMFLKKERERATADHKNWELRSA